MTPDFTIDRAVVLLGIQGGGKGTQAKILCDLFGIPNIDAGALLRWHLANRTRFAPDIEPILQGHYVKDEVVDQVMVEKIKSFQPGAGFLLDGYPRSIVQAESLMSVVGKAIVINLEIPSDIATSRLLSRVSCVDCNVVYSREAGNTCPKCGSAEQSVRADDTIDSIQTRLGHNSVKATATLRRLGDKYPVVSVNGHRSIDAVHNDILNTLRKECSNGHG